MPLYFFHLTDGHRSTQDPDGVELPDVSAARKEAVAMVVGLLDEAVLTGHDWTDWRVEISFSQSPFENSESEGQAVLGTADKP